MGQLGGVGWGGVGWGGVGWGGVGWRPGVGGVGWTGRLTAGAVALSKAAAGVNISHWVLPFLPPLKYQLLSSYPSPYETENRSATH